MLIILGWKSIKNSFDKREDWSQFGFHPSSTQFCQNIELLMMENWIFVQAPVATLTSAVTLPRGRHNQSHRLLNHWSSGNIFLKIEKVFSTSQLFWFHRKMGAKIKKKLLHKVWKSQKGLIFHKFSCLFTFTKVVSAVCLHLQNDVSCLFTFIMQSKWIWQHLCVHYCKRS